jgi:hypothetical protein
LATPGSNRETNPDEADKEVDLITVLPSLPQARLDRTLFSFQRSVEALSGLSRAASSILAMMFVVPPGLGVPVPVGGVKYETHASGSRGCFLLPHKFLPPSAGTQNSHTRINENP